jgi:hypothetical protein
MAGRNRGRPVLRRDTPFVVSLWIEGEEARERRLFDALATPSPEQARDGPQMAAALLLYADSADYNNSMRLNREQEDTNAEVSPKAQ